MTNIRVSTLRRLLGSRDEVENANNEEIVTHDEVSDKGYVERVENGKLIGWVIDSYPSETFSLRLKGMSYSPDVERLERDDVNAAFPEAALEAGFSIGIPAELLARGGQNIVGLKLFYGAQEISFLAEALEQLKMTKPVAIRKSDHAKMSGGAENIAFQNGLHVEFADPAQALQSELIFEFGNYKIRAHPTWGRDTFSYEIPSLVWEDVAVGKEPTLVLHGKEGFVGELIVSGREVVKALRQLVRNSETPQALTLLGLEHVRLLAKRMALPDEITRWALRTSELYQCTDFVSEFFPREASSKDPLPQSYEAGAARNAVVADILARFETNGAPSIAIVDQVISEHHLNGTEASAICEIMVSYFCLADCFDEIEDRLGEARVAQMATSAKSWEATLALPSLISRGKIRDAINALRNVDWHTGWLHTECIFDASRRVARSNYSFELKSEFCYALVALMQQLDGSYWSRVYDRFLAGSIAVWFEDFQRYPVSFATDLVNAAIRSLGLSRDFWDQLPEIEGGSQPIGTLQEARTAFNKIQTLRAMEQTPEVQNDSLLAMNTLRAMGTLDADAALRELALHALVTCSPIEAAYATAEVALRSLGEDEKLRLYAHPNCTENVPEALADHIADQIAAVIARDGGKHSTHASLKNWLGRQIAAIENGRELDHDALRRFMRLAKELNKSEFGFLTADLLLSLLSALGNKHPLASYLVAEANASLVDARNNGGLDFPAVQAAIDKNRNFSVLKQREMPGLHADTLVVIYSCRKYLEDRIPRLRETWISDLKARGIPYVILVGDGDDTLDGDLLHLDVADSYEALPDKTLKMIEWVLQNTEYRYMIKVDDDCYLNVDHFFDGLGYREHHYRGRILTKAVGEVARGWHQSKSHSALARKLLDRSPEPSIYCDGGSAYSLSRYAMRKVVETSRERWGRWLRSISFMEDKLVGDLLAHASIVPSEEDYFVHILRRVHPTSEPTTQYSNLFFTSSASPVSITHLDTAEPLAEHHDRNKSPVLEPKRIWPCHSPVKLGWNSNQLEYLSGPDKLQKVKEASHVVVAAMRNEMTLLPHFLDHYRNLGVDAFLIADNRSDDGMREYLQAQPDVAVFSVDTEYKASHFAVDWQQALLSNFCIGKWAIVVDADEFLTYDGVASRPLAALTADLDANGFDAVISDLVDMYPKGSLSDCDFSKGSPFSLAPYHDGPPVRTAPGTGHFSNTQSSVTSALRHRLMPGQPLALFMANKVPLLRYWPTMRFSEGFHFAGNVALSPQRLFLAHFKYHAGFAEKVQKEIHRKQHFGSGIEYQKYAMMLAETQGCLYDSDVSVNLSKSKFLNKASR